MTGPRRSRLLTVAIPAFADTATAYPLRAHAPAPRHIRLDPAAVQEPPAPAPLPQGATAEGHLNYGESLRGERPQRGSMYMVDGSVVVAAIDAGDRTGTVRARLREGVHGDGIAPPPATAELAAVFRLGARDVCDDDGRPARGGPGR